jgi:hypothetical protein
MPVGAPSPVAASSEQPYMSGSADAMRAIHRWVVDDMVETRDAPDAAGPTDADFHPCPMKSFPVDGTPTNIPLASAEAIDDGPDRIDVQEQWI